MLSNRHPCQAWPGKSVVLSRVLMDLCQCDFLHNNKTKIPVGNYAELAAGRRPPASSTAAFSGCEERLALHTGLLKFGGCQHQMHRRGISFLFQNGYVCYHCLGRSVGWGEDVYRL